MKKLLLVLLVVALASFLLVGCFGVPDGTEGEGEGEGEVGICPTVSVATEVEILGTKYINNGTRVITVTFAEATEPVSVYVGAKFDGDTATKGNPVGVPDSAQEVVLSASADKKVWTGKYGFQGDEDCDTAYIYVVTCATCAPCKFAYTVDNAGPCSKLNLRQYPAAVCSCGGINLQFYTPSAAAECFSTYCGDSCSGLDTYTVDLYKTNPFDTCCDVPCASPVATCSGTGCDIDCTIPCFDISAYYAAEPKDFYMVATLLDKVGNRTRYYAKINIDSTSINTVNTYTGTVCADFTGAGSSVTVSSTGVWEISTTGAGLYGLCP